MEWLEEGVTIHNEGNTMLQHIQFLDRRVKEPIFNIHTQARLAKTVSTLIDLKITNMEIKEVVEEWKML